MKYTKGEWRILEANNGTLFIRGDHDLQVCEYIMIKDDAHLIAAAPDMYEALKALIKPYTIPKDASFPYYPEYWVNTAKALAKAEGK